MPGLERLIACAGNWRGMNRLEDPTTGSPEDSPSTLTVTPLLGGRFVRLDYTWGWQGKPQEGSILVGFEPDAGRITTYWIDSWHMGHAALVSTGAAAEDGSLDVRGSWSVGDGPDWGWRTQIEIPGSDSLRIIMHNITPEGEESLAVDATYTPAG